MEPLFVNKEKIAMLLPMKECIEVMEKMFRSLAAGECLQPLRNIMKLPGNSGLLGMMPGHADKLGVMGIKVISVFHANKEAGFPSHQGIVMLFDEKNAKHLVNELSDEYNLPIHINKNVEQAVEHADIICTVTASKEPVVMGDWIATGTHINAVGSSTASSRELDTTAIVRSKLFTDRYESLFNEGGDFLIPKKEGAVTDEHVKAEIGEVLSGTKKGRENNEEITVFKSLGIAAEDIFSAYHIYQKIKL